MFKGKWEGREGKDRGGKQKIREGKRR